MSLFGLSAADRWECAVHEAGHGAVARHYGATVRLHLGRTSGSYQLSQYDHVSTADLAVIRLAGPAAARLLTGRDSGGRQDRAQARVELRGTGRTVRQAQREADRLVRRYRSGIEADARRLCGQGAAR
ncbi:hypothetical protein [Frankia sp. CiP1_Cm_nod1]|uniref:hypothetical protein n=1 Tax=Frankia sp. CiP1_Cm_nod1 TaxID=2897160 RepID=UPI0020246A86